MGNYVDIEKLRTLYDKKMMITLIRRWSVEEKLIYVILDTIKGKCKKRRICKGCIFYDINYGCLLDTRPDIWHTDIIKKNIDMQEEV